MNPQLSAAPPQGFRPPRGAVNLFNGQHRRRMLRTDLLAVLFWVSLAGAVALWLADGGASGRTVQHGRAQPRPCGHDRRRNWHYPGPGPA